MTAEPPDQRTILPAIVVKGIHTPATVAALKAASPAGSVFTVKATTDFYWRGQHLRFRVGIPYQLDSSLKAALTAAGIVTVAA